MTKATHRYKTHIWEKKFGKKPQGLNTFVVQPTKYTKTKNFVRLCEPDEPTKWHLARASDIEPLPSLQ